MTKCKGYPLDVFCCGDIIGYCWDLFLGYSAFVFGVHISSMKSALNI